MEFRRVLFRSSWDEWLNLQGVDVEDNQICSVQMDPSHLAIRAARNGVGVILESSVLVAKEVSDGTLTPLFPHLRPPGVVYWTYTPSAHTLYRRYVVKGKRD